MSDEKAGAFKLSKMARYFLFATIPLVVALLFLLSGYKFETRNDRNGDGEVDEWIYSNFFGMLVEFHRDKNNDGKVDYREYYKRVKVVRIEVDFDYDGFFETTGHYNPKTGMMTLLERDTNGDSKVDRKTIYDPQTGRSIRIEVDEDFDGVFELIRTGEDIKDEAPKPMVGKE